MDEKAEAEKLARWIQDEHALATERLWNALREECCTTGLAAHRIVMVTREDISKALKRINKSNCHG